MLYIESPAGVGFSYGPGSHTGGDESTATYNLQALLSFYKKFPEYLENEFHISGESYAGVYIPTLANKIIDYNAAPSDPEVPHVPLVGLAIGNGCTDPTECTNKAVIF
jgi:serine carboxypeptidase-like clade 2